MQIFKWAVATLAVIVAGLVVQGVTFDLTGGDFVKWMLYCLLVELYATLR